MCMVSFSVESSVSALMGEGDELWLADGQFKIVEESDNPIDPQTWNQFEPTSQGFACDWSDPSKGEKYKL